MLVRTEFPEPFSKGERNEDRAEGVTEARILPAREIRDASGCTGIFEVTSLGIEEDGQFSFVAIVPEDWTVLAMSVDNGTGCVVLAEVVDGGMACLEHLPVGRKIYEPLWCNDIISAIKLKWGKPRFLK